MLGVNDGADGVHCFVQVKIAVDDHIIERFDAFEFFARRSDANGKRIGGLRLARFEAMHQFLFGHGGDKDHQRFGRHFADGLRALHVEPHDHIFAAGERFAHLLFRDAFVIAVDNGMFDQFIVVNHARKLFVGHEQIIAPVHLAGALGTRGGSDHKMERQSALLHALHDGVFARAGRTGDDDEQRLRMMKIEFRHGGILPDGIIASFFRISKSASVRDDIRQASTDRPRYQRRGSEVCL